MQWHEWRWQYQVRDYCTESQCCACFELGYSREQEHMTVGSRSRAELSGSGYSFRFESETSSAVRTAAHQAIQKVVAGIGVKENERDVEGKGPRWVQTARVAL